VNTAIPTSDPDLPPGKRSNHLLLKGIAWVAAGVVVLVILIALSATILLHSTRFHNYVLSTVEK
jgi:hypothetical protein